MRLQVFVDVPRRRKHHRDVDGPVALREEVANRLKADNLRSVPVIRLKPAAEGTQKTSGDASGAEYGVRQAPPVSSTSPFTPGKGGGGAAGAVFSREHRVSLDNYLI